MLTLLTATGCRPKAWAICEQLMARQDYSGPVKWIVVDDGEIQQPITFERENWTLEIVRPEPFWKPGDNTQARNLKAGLCLVDTKSKLVIIEDDDAYSSDYLTWANNALDRADLIGESHARYYNVPMKKYRQLNNNRHASLCSTAMKGLAISAFAKELKPGVQFIDLNLWRNFQGSKSLERGNRVTGIKGLPGRTGIGMGHRADMIGNVDPSGSILRQWVGHNADLYDLENV